MSELILKVQPKKDFVFNPDKLVISTQSIDIINGTAIVSYQLTESGLNNSNYLNRAWIDMGSVQVPLALLVNVMDNNGNINSNVVNQFLAAFNI